jgi:hypothetical protein
VTSVAMVRVTGAGMDVHLGDSDEPALRGEQHLGLSGIVGDRLAGARDERGDGHRPFLIQSCDAAIVGKTDLDCQCRRLHDPVSYCSVAPAMAQRAGEVAGDGAGADGPAQGGGLAAEPAPA